MASFNEVTARLEATHAQLRGEVGRLNQELREANERLRRSERLAELGEMAAGIAHEIRNPLGAIGLYSEMLAKDLAPLGGGAEGAPAGVARRIGSEVRRLDAIVRDVLSFARELRVRAEPISPCDLFEAAVDSPRSGGDGGRGAVFERADLLPGRPGVVWCDRSLGLQALLNIVENAWQAMGERAGGAIVLDAKRVTVRGGGGAARAGVALVVRDAGPGIEAGVLERMFNPFFTTRQAGTGLGLAIVHRIVDAHGGGVVVRNNRELEPGARGVTVELHFPDAEAETERQG
jgi:signal transduction histidine kinase